MRCIRPPGGRIGRVPDAAPPRPGRQRPGAPIGKLISSLHFAANAHFYDPGIAVGVTERQHEFARALRDSGIRALRFPGGCTVYYYFPESPEASLQLVRTVSYGDFREAGPLSHFVTLEQLATFARQAQIALIYQLPCLFYLDGDTPRAIVQSKLSDRDPSLFDRKRVDEGVAYGLSIVRRLRELQAPVGAWELGNEEFAWCEAADYGEAAEAYAQAIREVDPDAPILVEGMGGTLPAVAPFLREGGLLSQGASLRVHHIFGNWPGSPRPAQNADPAAFVSGDVRFDRWLDVYAEQMSDLGLDSVPVSVSETMVFKHEEGYWDPYAMIGTHAHALLYAWNWMVLLASPEVDIAVFHDLESPYFGMLRYNVGFDRENRHFVWLLQDEEQPELDPKFEDQYVLSPTGCANRLLGELAGEELVTTNLTPSPTVRALASRERIVIVNRSEETIHLRAAFPRATAQALTADSLGACLPGTYRIGRIKTRSWGESTLAAIPPWSVAVVRRHR